MGNNHDSGNKPPVELTRVEAHEIPAGSFGLISEEISPTDITKANAIFRSGSDQSLYRCFYNAYLPDPQQYRRERNLPDWLPIYDFEPMLPAQAEEISISQGPEALMSSPTQFFSSAFEAGRYVAMKHMRAIINEIERRRDDLPVQLQDRNSSQFRLAYITDGRMNMDDKTIADAMAKYLTKQTAEYERQLKHWQKCLDYYEKASESTLPGLPAKKKKRSK